MISLKFGPLFLLSILLPSSKSHKPTSGVKLIPFQSLPQEHKLETGWKNIARGPWVAADSKGHSKPPPSSVTPSVFLYGKLHEHWVYLIIPFLKFIHPILCAVNDTLDVYTCV